MNENDKVESDTLGRPTFFVYYYMRFSNNIFEKARWTENKTKFFPGHISLAMNQTLNTQVG